MSDATDSTLEPRPKRQERKHTERRPMHERFTNWVRNTSWVRSIHDKLEKRAEARKPDADGSTPADNSSAWQIAVIILAILLVLVAVIGFNTVRELVRTKSSTVTTSDSKDKRDPRFIQKDVGHGDAYRIVGKGLDGKTSVELSKSLLDNAGHDAASLAVYANASGLWDDPNKVDPLLTKDKSYLSEEGIALWYKMSGAIEAKGTSAKVANAPSNGYNTGVDKNGRYGRSSVAGIRGDRTALYITFKDGSVLIVMKRCGNPVFTGKPRLPVVPTDNPKLTPKVASDDPAARGNAPEGGGRNADPSAGKYVPPAQMVRPPTTARINPPPPPAATTIPIGSTPDPTPPAVLEPGAPPASNGVTGTTNSPGK